MQISHQYNLYNATPQYFAGKLAPFSKELDKAMKNNDALSFKETEKLINLLRQAKREALNNSKILGSGYHGTVYKIDDKYALKTPQMVIKGLTAPIFCENTFKKLKTYYGNIIANFGDFKILKNLGNHTPIGIPHGMDKNFSTEQCNEYFYKTFLPKYAKLPQRAFDNIAEDCKTLNNLSNNNLDLSYIFDFVNPNNFVIKGKKIYITDEIICNQKYGNNISDLLRGLLNYKELGSPTESNKTNIKYFRNLYKKIILAGLKYDLPFGFQYGKCNWEYCTENLCKSKDDVITVIQNLKLIKNNSTDKITELKNAKNYLNSIFKDNTRN